MKVAIISDSHGLVPFAKAAMIQCRERNVERIIHCGDIGGPEMIDIFCELPADFVLGNCDGSMTYTLARHITQKGGTFHDMFGSVEIEGKKIAFTHGHDEELLQHEIESGHWDLVCYGHTHQHEIHACDRTTVLNPGAFRRRFEAPGFCIVDLPHMSFTRISLE